MPRTIPIAALQIDARPAPTRERLAVADRLVREAHDQGAQLVVLPEVFNTGYGYTDSNYECTKTLEIADAHASFGVTCRRWNIGLADGGTQRLPRIVGMGGAMELIITGRVIDAEEALSIGLVNEVVPSGTCVERAIEMTRFISALPQPAIRTDKEAAVRGFGRDLDEGLLIEAQAFNRSIADPATLEGLRQFTERDHPDRVPDQAARTPGLVRD